MKVNWDLSRSQTVADVGWPTDELDRPAVRLEQVESAKIAVAGGRVLEMGARTASIGLYKPLRIEAGEDERTVEMVEVYTTPLEVPEAYEEALALAEQLDIPRGGIDAWRQRRERGVDPAVDRTVVAPEPPSKPLGGKGGPKVSVELNYSANDERPWIVLGRLSWRQPSR